VAGEVRNPSGSYSGNPFLDMLLQMFPQLMNGGIAGQWNPTQNITDTLTARDFTAGQSRAANRVGGPEVARNINELIHGRDGTGGAVGMGWMSAQQGAYAQSMNLGGYVSSAMPFMSLTGAKPIDALGFGASAQASNYYSMFRGAHATYGQPGSGLSASQIEEMAVSMSRGVGASLYGGGNTSQYGFGRGFGSALSVSGQQMGISPSAQALAGMSPQGQISAMTQSEGGLMRGAAAIRDLGGGYASLNPQQMLQALDTFSQGRLSKGEDAGELGMDVRKFKALSGNSGVGMDYANNAAFHQFAGALAQSQKVADNNVTNLGLHAQAFSNVMSNKGNQNKTGLSPDYMAQMDAKLGAQELSGNKLNMAAALMRMGEEGMLKNPSEAYSAYQALKTKGEFAPVSMADFKNMVKRDSKDDENRKAIEGVLKQPDQNNKEYGAKVISASRGAQWDKKLGPNMVETIVNTIGKSRGGTIDDNRARQIAKKITNMLRNSGGMSEDEINKAVEAELRNEQIDADMAKELTIQIVGAAGLAARRLGYRTDEHGNGLLKAINAHDPDHIAAVRDELDRAGEEAREADAAAGIGQGGVVERVINAAVDGDKTLMSFLGKVAGGFNNAGMANTLVGTAPTLVNTVSKMFFGDNSPLADTASAIWNSITAQPAGADIPGV